MKILPNGIAVLENDLISSWVEQSGRLDHDQNTLPIVLPHIKQGDWVVDGGAFIGDHTIAYIEKVGPSGRVFAFEPNYEAFVCLHHNCKFWSSTCQMVPMGLGEARESSVVTLDCQNMGASFLTVGSGTINITSIDLLDFPRLDFLKMDIEGMEYSALIGGGQTIQKHRPKMLLEINRGALARNDHHPELIYNFLDSMGYTYFPIWPTSKLNDEQLDIICIPK